MIRVDRPQSLFCFIPQEKGLIRWVWGLARSEGISPIFAVPCHLHLLQTNIPTFALALTIWGRQTDMQVAQVWRYEILMEFFVFVFAFLTTCIWGRQTDILPTQVPPRSLHANYVWDFDAFFRSEPGFRIWLHLGRQTDILSMQVVRKLCMQASSQVPQPIGSWGIWQASKPMKIRSGSVKSDCAGIQNLDKNCSHNFCFLLLVFAFNFMLCMIVVTKMNWLWRLRRLENRPGMISYNFFVLFFILLTFYTFYFHIWCWPK